MLDRLKRPLVLAFQNTSLSMPSIKKYFVVCRLFLMITFCFVLTIWRRTFEFGIDRREIVGGVIEFSFSLCLYDINGEKSLTTPSIIIFMSYWRV